VISEASARPPKRLCWVHIMTPSVQKFLTTFDALSDSDKLVAALEVLRRMWPEGVPALDDKALIEAADALFADLDVREAADAQR